MIAPSAHIAAKIAHVAASVNSSKPLDAALESIVQAAVHTVPGFNHVGISITHGDGTIETRAATDQLVWDLDDLQYSLREGPCYDAMRGETITVVNHAKDDLRWPHYMPEAAKRGLRSQLGIGLYNNEESLGGLNLYSTESDTIANEAVIVAELFAAHATMALGFAREVSQLQKALDARNIVGQAVGIAMERFHLDDDDALQFLVRISQRDGIRLNAVAQDLVDTTIRKTQGGEVK